MIIKGGKVLDNTFNFTDTDVVIDGEKIKALDNAEGDFLDAADCYVLPGFIDSHMHGAMGSNFIDFTDDSYRKVCEFEAKNGTTGLVPALSAAPEKKMMAAVKYLKKCAENPEDDCTKIYGIHLEGPFFAEAYKGAHLPENIRNPKADELQRYVEAADGLIKIITMAPELPGAEETIKYAVSHSVAVSAGHTNATYEEIERSIPWGVTRGTHTFNAMSPLKHRAAGTVGALLNHSELNCELICDFFHVNPEVLELTYKIKGSDNMTMITDSEIGTGLGDGVYDVNGRKITVADGKTYTEDGTIAGGTSCLIDGVRNLVSIGIPLEAVCKMATKNPALAAGIYDTVGSITPGKNADIVIIDKDLNLKHVILRGKLLY